MKKINYLLPTLLVVPLLASCGCSKKTNYKVNEAEFNKAVKLEGVEFLQVQQNMGTLEIKYEFSPTIFFGTTIKDDTLMDAIMVRKKDDGSYEKVSKSKGDDDWGNVKPAEPEEFEILSNNEDVVPFYFVQNAYKDYGFELSYDKFSFSNKRYHCETPDGEAELFLYFVNKKCVKLVIGSGDLVEAEMSYAYKNETPVWPK